ncbi:MAG: pilus assembly protein PilM [bacterium]
MPQRIVSLEIGETELKAAILQTSFRDYKVTGFYRQALNGNGDAQIKQFLAQHGEPGDTILTALAGDRVTWRTFFLPFRDVKKLAQTVPFELESTVPFGLDEVVVDYQVLHRDRAGTTVLAALVPREELEHHLERMQRFGADPKVVDVGPLATLNTLSLVPDLPPTFAFLDFGPRSVTIALYRERILTGLRTLDCAAAPAPEETNGAAALPLDETTDSAPPLLLDDVIDSEVIDDAAALLLDEAIDGAPAAPHDEATNGAAALPLDEVAINGVAAWSLDELIGDVRWSLLALNGAPLDEDLICYIAGAPGLLAEIEPVLAQLPAEVRRLDRVALRNLTPDVGAQAPAFSSSLGLALREMAPAATLGVNFRRGEFTFHRGQQELRAALRTVAVLGVIVMLLTVLDMFVKHQQLQSQVAGVEAQIAKIFSATMPDALRVPNPKAALQEETDALRQRVNVLTDVVPVSTSTSIDILRAAASAVPTKVRIDCEEYAMDPNEVRVRCNTDTYESVDTIKEGLQKTGFFSDVEVKDAKNSPKGGGIDFRMVLKLNKNVRPPGGTHP